MEPYENAPMSRNEHNGRSLDAEHAGLRVRGEQIGLLLESLAGRAHGHVDQAQASEARVVLAEFDQQLCDHFSNEERKGVLDLAVTVAPRLSRKAEQLSREHLELRAQMQAVLAAAEGAAWLHAHEVFVAMRCAPAEHEHAEEDILRSAYLEDVGGG